MNQSTGVHCILELMECPHELLDDEAFIRQAVIEATAVSGSTLLSLTSHKFSPQGVTALGLLAESHLSIHTWPETGYAAADVFTCGSSCDPHRACRFLIRRFKSAQHQLSVVERGPVTISNAITFPGLCTDKEKCIRTNLNPPYG